jgi:monovalent cation/proton antiporter MnhG/PhaG subunit
MQADALHLLGMLLLIIGTAGSLIGVLGVARMPDFHTRLQAAGMVITFGAGGVLLGVMVLSGPPASLKALATAGFLVLTAPMVTHVLARTAYRMGVGAGTGAPDELAEDQERQER